MPLNFLKRLVWKLFISKIARVILFCFGFYSIDRSYADKRILRIRSQTDPSTSFSSIPSSECIISNYLGYMQILLYTAVISDRFGFVNNKDEIVCMSFLPALRQAIHKEVLTAPGVSLDQAISQSPTPLVLFLEVLPTNGKGVIQFKSLGLSNSSLLKNSNLMGVKFTGSLVNPSHSTPSISLHLYYLLSQFKVTTQITWLSRMDLSMLPESENLLEQYRILLAGLLGIEALDLGETEGRNFLQYFKTRNNKDKRV